MALIPVGFNSDELVPDEDEDESALNPFFNAGKRTAGELVRFAMTDRLASKKRIKNLRDIAGAPGSVYVRQLWMNYFRAFVVNVMGDR